MELFCSCIHLYVLLSPYLYCISFLYLDLYVLGDDALISKGSFMQTKHLCVLILVRIKGEISTVKTGLRSAVGNVSGYRCVSDCRSRGREFDPGPVPYFRGD